MNKYVLALLGLAGRASAYANSSKTEAYLQLTNNDPVHAIMTAYEGVWGGWFYLLLAAGPYMAMYLTQESMHVPTIWLICILASYNFLFTEVPQYVFYLIPVFWVLTVLMKLLSPIYKK